MNGDGSDLLEDMDYGDFNLLEEPSGEFSFDGAFDGESQEFSNHSSGSNLFVVPANEGSSPGSHTNGRGSSAAAAQQQQQGLAQLLTNAASANALSIRGGVGGAAEADNSSHQQPWHSDEKDRDGRRRMIIEIAQLLRARKRNQPSDAWLRQLPCKARKLEERLYRSAVSFDAYDDKATLKHRLKRLARTIMKQYEHTSQSRSSIRSAGTSSTMSSRNSSIVASRNNSVVSHLQQHRDSMLSMSSLDSLSSLNASMQHQMTGLGNEQQQRGNPERSNSSGSSSNGNRAAAAPAGTAANNASLRAIPEEQGGSSSMGSDKISMLEQQKQANERLQHQILENIRKQEELLRRLQHQQVGGGPSSVPSTGGMVQGNNNNNLWGGQMGASMGVPGNASSAPSGGDPQQQSAQLHQSQQQHSAQARQQQQQHQQLRLPGNGMPANLNSLMMNPSVLNNPAQMQQLAQMQAALLQHHGGAPMAQSQLQQRNPLMRSSSAGTPSNMNMTGSGLGFPGMMQAGQAQRHPQSQSNQQQSQSLQQQQQNAQNSLTMATMLNPNMVGLQAPPILPMSRGNRATSTGGMGMNGFAGGFNPAMPPPPGGTAPGGGTSGTPASGSNQGFSQFNWGTNV